mgnify:CR=1 FL=1
MRDNTDDLANQKLAKSKKLLNQAIKLLDGYICGCIQLEKLDDQTIKFIKKSNKFIKKL